MEPLCWRKECDICGKLYIKKILSVICLELWIMCEQCVQKVFREIVHTQKCERVLLMTFSYQLSVDEFGISDCFERHLWREDLINVSVERRYLSTGIWIVAQRFGAGICYRKLLNFYMCSTLRNCRFSTYPCYGLKVLVYNIFYSNQLTYTLTFKG